MIQIKRPYFNLANIYLNKGRIKNNIYNISRWLDLI